MLRRIVTIHRLIKDGTYPNTARLARETEASTASISRDIRCMRDILNAPVEYDRIRHGYYYDGNYDLPLNQLSPHDAQVLASAKALLSHYRGTPVYAQAEAVLDLLCAPAGGTDASRTGRIAVPPSPEPIIDEGTWNAVVRALRENRVLEFDYTGRWKPETRRRVVRPYQLLIEDGVCSLFGYAEECGAERVFVLSRMADVAVTERGFALPEDFDFAGRCGGGRFGAFSTEKRTRYRIAFYGNGRARVRECVWADDQTLTEGREATTLTFSASQGDRVLEWVLSFGGNAKPLAPRRFVEQWEEQVHSMQERAENR